MIFLRFTYMSSLKLRFATAEDAQQIVDIYSPYVLTCPFTFETEVPTVEEYQDRIKEVQEFFPFFVLENDGKIVGYSCAHFYHPRKAYRWNAETTIYVIQGSHRNGYASILYNALLAALKDQGIIRAVAILGCPNEPSERFHEAFGFKKIATFDSMGYKCDAWSDVVYYMKELNPIASPPREPVSFYTLDTDKYLIINK